MGIGERSFLMSVADPNHHFHPCIHEKAEYRFMANNNP